MSSPSPSKHREGVDERRIVWERRRCSPSAALRPQVRSPVRPSVRPQCRLTAWYPSLRPAASLVAQSPKTPTECTNSRSLLKDVRPSRSLGTIGNTWTEANILEEAILSIVEGLFWEWLLLERNFYICGCLRQRLLGRNRLEGTKSKEGF